MGHLLTFTEPTGTILLVSGKEQQTNVIELDDNNSDTDGKTMLCIMHIPTNFCYVQLGGGGYALQLYTVSLHCR